MRIPREGDAPCGRADTQASWQPGQRGPWWAGEAFRIFIYSKFIPIPIYSNNFYLFQFLCSHDKLVNFTL